ncbi:MAG: TonB-dependent receptor, partial [Hyphomicrobiales bacterium]
INPITGALTPFTTDLSLSTQTLFCGGAIPDASNFNASGSALFFGIDPTPLTDLAPFTSILPDGLGNEYGAWRANLSFEWDVGDHTLTGIASQGEAELGGIQDAFFGEDGVLNAPSTQQFRSPLMNWTQDTFFETRLTSSPDNRLRYAIGASYYKQEFRNGNGNTLQGNINFQDNEAIGIFGTLDFDITDELTLSAEGRWVDDEQTIVYDGAHGLADPLAVTNDSLSYTDFMPRVILSYSPHSDLNVYASWSESSLNGIATGSARFSATTGIPTPGVGNFTNIQRLTSYEVGVKQEVSSWFNYSLSAYYMKWNNQPFSSTVLLASPFGFTSVFLNADGNSEYKGIDFEVSLTPTDGLDLFGSIGWVDAEVNELGQGGSVASSVLCPTLAPQTNGPLCSAFGAGQSATILADGNQPRNVAEWSGAVGANYTFALGQNDFYVRGDALYLGKRFVDNFEYNFLKSSWKLNARAGGSVSDNLRMEFFVENLLGNEQFTGGGTTGVSFSAAFSPGRKFFGTLPDKREVGVRVMFDF